MTDRNIDTTKPGPDADRIAELKREIAERESAFHMIVDRHRQIVARKQIDDLRAELSRLRDEQPKQEEPEEDFTVASPRYNRSAPSPAPSPEPQDVRGAESSAWAAFWISVEARGQKYEDMQVGFHAGWQAALAQSDAQPSQVRWQFAPESLQEAWEKWERDGANALNAKDNFGAGYCAALLPKRGANQSDAQPVGWRETLDAAINFIADEYRTREYEDQGEWLPPEARAIHAKLLALRYGNTAPHSPDASGLIEAAVESADAREVATKIAARPALAKLIDSGALKWDEMCDLRDDIEKAIRSRAADRSAPR